MAASDSARLSVSIVDVAPGREADFASLADEFEAILIRRNYGRADTIRDEAQPLRFYVVRHWNDAASAAQCDADRDVRALGDRLFSVARVTHVINGALPETAATGPGERRGSREADRRSGTDRRQQAVPASPPGERRSGRDRRLGPRRLRTRPTAADLVGAARRARGHAEAAFSHFKVGAALETADGALVTGCNVENATYGLTLCAERVAMFKAISEGHRAFSRIAIVADTDAPTPPCGACRQILWEFGGNLEILLANLTDEKGVHRLKDLLPLPFDARLL